MSKSDIKNSFRKLVLNSCKKRANNYKKDKLIVKNLIKYIQENRLSNIMLFIPLANEVNILPLINYCRRKNINIYVPFMQGKSFILVKYRLPLGIKKFKIKEPKFSSYKIRDIDLAIVPILGIDIKSKRVGFGKGMYDRFYAKNWKKIKKTIFIQRDLYICNKCITNNFDIYSDTIITHSVNFITCNGL